MRSAFVYRYTGTLTGFKKTSDNQVEAHTLSEETIQTRAAKDPEKLSAEAGGFVPVIEGQPEHLFTMGNLHFLRFEIRKRVIPAAVVTREVKKRIDAQPAPPARAMRLQIRDEVLMDLLPRAFIAPSSFLVCIDAGHQLVIAGTSSAPASDWFSDTLRALFSGMKLESVTGAQGGIAETLRLWLTDEPADGYHIGDAARLVGVAGDKISAVNEDLLAENFLGMVPGRSVDRLGLTWQNRLEFALSSDLKFGGIRFTDLMNDSLSNMNSQSDVDDERNRLFLWGSELSALVNDLLGLLPGFEMAAPDA